MRAASSGSPPFVRRAWSIFTCHDQGVSHAEWPKDNHENAPTQTGIVICSPLEAVDIECLPSHAERFSKRAKKLRTVFGVGPN
jgi:hypothetical protein